MERPARPLPFLGGALVIAVASLTLWMAAHGPTTAASVDVARAIEVMADEQAAPTPAAELPVAEASARTERVAIASPEDIAAAEQAAALDERELCSIEGVLLVPQTFPGSAPATVHAWPVGDERESAPASVEVITQDGWRIEDLPPGTWVFVARAESDGRIAWGRSQEIQLIAGVEARALRLVLTEYSVEGIVTDSSGRPIPGVGVTCEWRENDNRAGKVIRTMEPITVSGLTFQQTSDFKVSFAAGVTVNIRGPFTIGETDNPSGTVVRFIQPSAGGDLTRVQTLDLWVGKTVTTDANGRFRLALEGPGTARVSAPGTHSSFIPTEPRWIRATTTAKASLDQPEAHVELSLQRAARVTGRLLRSDGDAAEGMNVFLRRSGARSTTAARTDAEGIFNFDVCAPGDYLFYARSGGTSGQDFSVHARFTLREGHDFVLNEVLTPSSSVIGTVLDDANNPVAGAVVTARGVDNDNVHREGRTDASGQFTIVGMYSCEYSLIVNGRTILDPVTVLVRANGDRVHVGTLVVQQIDQ